MFITMILIALMNPSTTEYDNLYFQDDLELIESYSLECESEEQSDEYEKLLSDVLMGTRRGAWDNHSADDIYWLYQCVEAEEGGNNHRAKYLAACCILNRARLGWGGSTITDVIFAKSQFAVVTSGRINRVKVSEDTIRACNEALDYCENWVIAFAQGNLHKNWAQVCEVHNGEYFYK